ncbi:MAG: Ig-like domain-containing domain [Planctomycetota bacterium]
MALVLLGALLVGCSGSGGGSGADKDTQDLWVERFSVPNFSGILLDEGVNLVFSERIKAKSLNHDSVRMRTGAQGGEAPLGVFIKGIFLIDVEGSGNRVVIDPDQIGPGLLRKIQAKGRVDRVPDEIRYDLGAESTLNGSRQVLFNHTFSSMVTFVPEIPTRPDLSDTGYVPGATYTVVVPAFPVLNTVNSVGGDPVLPREGKVFVTTFTTVPSNSPQLFLGGENVGSPRVINTDPPNGGGNVEADDRIFLRFSQPLDPRFVTTANFFLETVSTPDRQQIPISLFLRQTRRGLVEVVMTPLQDLGPKTFFEVTVSGGVLDLLRSPMAPFVFSFSTGDVGPPVTDIVESFDSNSREAMGLSTANWNGTKPFVGATPGALTAVFAPFAGNGTDLEFDPPVGETTILPTDFDPGTGVETQRIYNYTDTHDKQGDGPPDGIAVFIRIGAQVIGEGKHALVMRCQGGVEIDFGIGVSGSDGGQGDTGSAGEIDPKGGPGGIAGPGGWDGGDGAFRVIGSAGNPDGIDGDGPGGGAGGGSGDQELWDGTSFPVPPDAVREGGGGGGHGTAGSDADVANFKNTGGGRGGGTHGQADMSDTPLVPAIVGVRTPTLGFGGSGGGGGGGEDDHANPSGNPPILGDGIPGGEDEGGGGGGGGGGVLQIVAYGDIIVRGRIDANGGNGGRSWNEARGEPGQGGPGGAGAGGAIWLQSFGDIELDQLARLEAVGGIGGIGNWNDKEQVLGGAGGDGYIRLEDKDGNIFVPDSVTPQTTSITGTFSPPLELDSTGQSVFYNQRIPTPNYDEPVFDLALNGDGNSIVIHVQGAREDVTLPGDQAVDPDSDPERTFSTDWVLVYDSGETPAIVPGAIDKMDNFQYVRFRVEFSVDPLHNFEDPLPTVREIRIPLLETPD